MPDYNTLLTGLTSQTGKAVNSSGAIDPTKTTAVLYSGTPPNGTTSNEDLAKNCTANDPSTYTIEMTGVGQYFDNTIKPAFAAGQITQAQYWQLGNVASQIFTTEATGNAIALVDGA